MFLSCENDTRFKRTIGTGNDRITRQHKEARDVSCVVLDPVGENLKSVELSCSCARYRRRVVEVVSSDVFRRRGCVVKRFNRCFWSEFVERSFRLSQSLRMRNHSRDAIRTNSGKS
uniref:Uncharacterized protein n=1 Tax=Arabidopsis thaliana TaxID=3702 RepID=Q8GX80_ARATH|nr:unknown protein [Arabidopsis thaliana]